MGGHDSEIGPTTRLIALESAYFQPRVDPPDEQAARAEDRGVDPLRARRRHRLRLRSASPGPRRCSRGIGAGTPRRRRSSIATRRRGRPAQVLLRASRIARLLGQAVPADDVARILDGARLRRRDARQPVRTGLAGDRADVPRRRHARSGPDRGGRPPLRVRSSAGHVSRARRATGRRPTAADRAGPAHPAGR